MEQQLALKSKPKKTGIFSSINTGITTTLDATTSVLASTLGVMDETAQVMHNLTREFNNDSKSDLVTSMVGLAQTKSGAVTDLKALNYTDEQIDALLATIK